MTQYQALIINTLKASYKYYPYPDPLYRS